MGASLDEKRSRHPAGSRGVEVSGGSVTAAINSGGLRAKAQLELWRAAVWVQRGRESLRVMLQLRSRG